MLTKNKVASMSVTRRLLMMAAFAGGLWDRGNLYLEKYSSGGPAYRPQRKKFKGWKRQQREN